MMPSEARIRATFPAIVARLRRVATDPQPLTRLAQPPHTGEITWLVAGARLTLFDDGADEVYLEAITLPSGETFTFDDWAGTYNNPSRPTGNPFDALDAPTRQAVRQRLRSTAS